MCWNDGISTLSHVVETKYSPIIQKNRNIGDCRKSIDAKYFYLKILDLCKIRIRG